MATQYVEGLKELVRTLEKFSDGIATGELKDMFASIGEMVAADARARAPRKSGRLAASIKPTKTKNKAAVRVGGARVPYAGVIEYGWRKRGIAAQSYLRDAINADEGRAIDLMIAGVNDLIHKLGLDEA